MRRPARARRQRTDWERFPASVKRRGRLLEPRLDRRVLTGRAAVDADGGRLVPHLLRQIGPQRAQGGVHDGRAAMTDRKSSRHPSRANGCRDREVLSGSARLASVHAGPGGCELDLSIRPATPGRDIHPGGLSGGNRQIHRPDWRAAPCERRWCDGQPTRACPSLKHAGSEGSGPVRT
jgi:hypothetical protein